jgi:hypothetical protein
MSRACVARTGIGRGRAGLIDGRGGGGVHGHRGVRHRHGGGGWIDPGRRPGRGFGLGSRSAAGGGSGQWGDQTGILYFAPEHEDAPDQDRGAQVSNGWHSLSELS